MEIDNLWFLKIQYVPQSNVSLLKLKYDKEILRTSVQTNENTQKNLKNNLLKILKHDYAMDFSKCYCLKITDSFQAKKISFFILINESNANQLELRIMIKKSTEEALYFHQNLIEYLKRIQS